MPFAKISSSLNRGVEYSLSCLGLALAAVVAAQVFSRYVLNYSLFWSEELARFLLVWLTFLGATVAYFHGAHASVDFLVRRLSARGQKAATVCVHLGALAFSLIMLAYGWQFAAFVRLQISPALSLPKWIPHGVIPLSGAIMALHSLTFISQNLGRPGRDR